MNAVDGMLFGLQVAFQWDNLVACFIGVLVGTLVGVLPGIGPVGAMALLLPLTFTLTPTAALIMLAGIYYGSMYGGSTTSILLRIPGCVASMVATLDGYEMAKRGRAGSALFLTTIASFIAGTVGIVGLAFVGPALANAALHFGPPEFFALCVVAAHRIISSAFSCDGLRGPDDCDDRHGAHVRKFPVHLRKHQLIPGNQPRPSCDGHVRRRRTSRHDRGATEEV
jgi:TctA family transporter